MITTSKKRVGTIFVITLLILSLFGAMSAGFGTEKALATETTNYSFEYQIIGKTFDLGERIGEVVINTQNYDVSDMEITPETFYVQRKVTKAIIGGESGIYKHFPSAVEITDGSTIVLTFNYSADLILFNVNRGLFNNGIEMTVQIDRDLGTLNKNDITLTESPLARKNPDVEIFSAHSVTSASGATVNYRLFQPDGEGLTKAPLIVWLNTAAETGNDNRLQVSNVPLVKLTTTNNQTFFGANGAYIIAPQSPDMGTLIGSSWGNNTCANFKTAIDQVISLNNIDTSRIYIFGGSLGAGFTLQMIHAYPNFFAAAIECSTNGKLRDVMGENATDEEKLAGVKAIADTGLPIYFIHSINDGMPTNPPAESVMSWKDYTEAGGEGYLSLYNNVYVEGNTSDIAHNTWLLVMNNFDGSGNNLFINGSGILQNTSYGDLSYVSTKPIDAAGGHTNILSWLASKTKN